MMQDAMYAGYDGAFYLVDRFTRPSRVEIEAFDSGSPGEIRFLELNGVIFFLLRLGNMPWQDAAFSPNWYGGNIVLPEISEGEGFMFLLSLVDNETGSQIANRMVGFGHRQSVILRDMVARNFMNGFDKATHIAKINDIYSRYSTEQLAALCPADQRYKLRSEAAVDPKPGAKAADAGDPLAAWRCNPADCGFTDCARCIPECLLKEASGKDLDGYLVPIPVRYLKDRGYRVLEDGHICVDVKYNRFTGAEVPDEYWG